MQRLIVCSSNARLKSLQKQCKLKLICIKRKESHLLELPVHRVSEQERGQRAASKKNSTCKREIGLGSRRKGAKKDLTAVLRLAGIYAENANFRAFPGAGTGKNAEKQAWDEEMPGMLFQAKFQLLNFRLKFWH